jgi:hypothetical protein
MALIKCEECGREVSDKAKTCPGCGAPVPQAEEEADIWTRMKSPRGNPQEVVVRGTDVGYEAEKLGYRLMMGVLALFLHPYFAFVGFYLLCLFIVAGMSSLAGEALGANIDNPPGWAIALILAAPIPLVYLLRNYVRTIMKWLLVALAVILMLNIVLWLFF